MVLLAVVNNLFPLSVGVEFGEVDPVIGQCEVRGKISAFVFECSLLLLESGNIVVCSFEGAKYVWVEAKLRDSIVRVGSQDARDIFVPLIASDPAAVAYKSAEVNGWMVPCHAYAGTEEAGTIVTISDCWAG